MAGASFTKTAQLAGVSIGTVTKVTFVFRSMGGKDISIQDWKLWLTAHIWSWCSFISAICKENRRATLPQVTENVNAGHDQTVSAIAVCWQLHREGYYSRTAVHKPLITKMNAHLRVQWWMLDCWIFLLAWCGCTCPLIRKSLCKSI